MTKTRTLVTSGLLILTACDKEALKQKDAQINQIQSELTQCKAEQAQTIKRHTDKAEVYKQLASSRVSPTAQEDLQRLIKALSAHTVYPDDAPRIADSLMQHIQRLGNTGIYPDMFKYKPLDENLKVLEPLRAVNMFKSLFEGLVVAGKLPQTDLATTLAWQFGDEEAAYVLKTDLVAAQRVPSH